MDTQNATWVLQGVCILTPGTLGYIDCLTGLQEWRLERSKYQDFESQQPLA